MLALTKIVKPILFLLLFCLFLPSILLLSFHSLRFILFISPLLPFSRFQRHPRPLFTPFRLSECGLRREDLCPLRPPHPPRPAACLPRLAVQLGVERTRGGERQNSALCKRDWAGKTHPDEAERKQITETKNFKKTIAKTTFGKLGRVLFEEIVNGISISVDGNEN